MKPQHTIAFVVIAVLATVVVEEMRISKMRAEIIRLQALPADLGSTPPVAETATADEATEPAESTEPATDMEEPPAAAEESAAAPAGRVIPEDFPEIDPDDPKIKQLAMGPYSDFAYEIGLNNRERAYLDDLLTRRNSTLQSLASNWLEAPSPERPALEDMMTLVVAKSDDAIATFLASEADAKAFANYHAMQPEREKVANMSADLDQAGATLDIDKERELIEALYQARVGTGSLDWNSPAALRAIAEGGALDRFEKEWQAQSQALAGLLPKFLSESEATAVLASREDSKAGILASIVAASEAVHGEEEE